MRVDISNELRKYRIAKGMSQEDLANEAEISIATVKKIEQNKVQPSITMLCKLAYALEVTPHDLIKPAWDRFCAHKDLHK